MIIKESYLLTASNTDILAAPSRLASIPADGVMTIEVSSTDNDGTNYGQLTLQTPGGDTPFENLVIPQNGFSTADGVIHDDTAIVFQLEVDQGGHVTLSYTENGTVAGTMVIITLDF